MRAVCNYIQPDVGADLKQAPSSLTSLDATTQWYFRAVEHDAPLSEVLQGISSLRRLSCYVRTLVSLCCCVLPMRALQINAALSLGAVQNCAD